MRDGVSEQVDLLCLVRFCHSLASSYSLMLMTRNEIMINQPSLLKKINPSVPVL